MENTTAEEVGAADWLFRLRVDSFPAEETRVNRFRWVNCAGGATTVRKGDDGGAITVHLGDGGLLNGRSLAVSGREPVA